MKSPLPHTHLRRQDKSDDAASGRWGVVSVCLHIVLDGAAAAPYEAAWCRSNRESIQNQRSERHRSQRSVLLRVPGRMCGHHPMGDRCRTSGTIAAAACAGRHFIRRSL
jgi:hypothetical protein